MKITNSDFILQQKKRSTPSGHKRPRDINFCQNKRVGFNMRKRMHQKMKSDALGNNIIITESGLHKLR